MEASAKHGCSQVVALGTLEKQYCTSSALKQEIPPQVLGK